MSAQKVENKNLFQNSGTKIHSLFYYYGQQLTKYLFSDGKLIQRLNYIRQFI